MKKNRHVGHPAHRWQSKALISTAGLLLCISQTFAQPASQQHEPYTYCTITGSMKALDKEPSVKVECEEKETKYKSMAQAMTTMSDNGWTFIQAYSFQAGMYMKEIWIIRKKK